MTNHPRIDLLFQYALARAARADDFRWRELGPIHLLKYAYLADLARIIRGGLDSDTSGVWKVAGVGLRWT